MISDKQYTLDELCKLVDLPKRTIRYYIQQGLVNRPDGEKRGSHYTQQHLEQLLEIKKWQKEGLSLERIKTILTIDIETLNTPLAQVREPGDITVCSHIFIEDGIELQIDPKKVRMSAEELRSFISKITALYKQEKSNRRQE